MQAFREYVISEYKPLLQTLVGTEFKFVHNVSTKHDKKSNTIVRVDTIRCAVKFFDKDMNQLLSSLLVFENNEIKPKQGSALIHIAPAELNNKFMAAKADIIKVINDEYISKRDEFTAKMTELAKYNPPQNNVTPAMFEGLNVVIHGPAETPAVKKVFDM